jgi:molecular chaperone DnaK (HSP70)
MDYLVDEFKKENGVDLSKIKWQCKELKMLLKKLKKIYLV